jgi:hypothetical protein
MFKSGIILLLSLALMSLCVIAILWIDRGLSLKMFLFYICYYVGVSFESLERVLYTEYLVDEVVYANGFSVRNFNTASS